MIVPIEIFNYIIEWTGDSSMIVPFKNLLYENTIDKLWEQTSIKMEIVKGNIELLEYMETYYNGFYIEEIEEISKEQWVV